MNVVYLLLFIVGAVFIVAHMIFMRNETAGNYGQGIIIGAFLWLVGLLLWAIMWANEFLTIEGDLPDPLSVPEGSWVLAFCVTHITMEEYEQSCRMKINGEPQPFPHPNEVNGKFSCIEPLFTYGNELNPIRWCDTSQHPFGYLKKVKYYAWIKR